MDSASSYPIALVAADQVLRDAVGMSLAARGFPVCAFPSAADFIGHSLAATTRCVVADLAHADGQSGESDAKALARMMGVNDPAMPIIFLTGMYRPEVWRGSNVLLLAKPVDPALLSAQILKMARRS